MSIRSVFAVFLSVLVLGYAADSVDAQTTGFSYQGSLADGGGMADRMYDFEFGVFDALSGGSLVGTDVHLGVQVLDGLFTVELDFGSVPFDLGSDRWLEVSVRLEGAGSYTTLDPRTMLGRVPYATHSEIAEFANTALSGPFAPLDTTPKSRAGAGRPNTFIYDHELRIGSAVYTQFEIDYPITVEQITQPGGQSGRLGEFSISVTRPYLAPSNQPSDWNTHFQNNHPVDYLEIQFEANNTDAVRYEFGTGLISKHEILHRTNQGLFEKITIEFSPASGQNVEQTIDRIPVNFVQTGSPLLYPYAGGHDAITPGDLNYEINGDIPGFTTPTRLPTESKTIDFNGGGGFSQVQVEPIELIMNPFADENNQYFEFFINGNPLSLELHNSQSRLWSSTGPGITTGWSLDKADDGGLFERYEYDYLFVP